MSTDISNTPNPLLTTCTEESASYLRVIHETLYQYPGPASLAYNTAWMAPLARIEQQVLEHHLLITPHPQFQHTQTDSFGNRMHYFEVHSPHSELKVVSKSVIVRQPKPLNKACSLPWEQMRFTALRDHAQKAEFCPFAYPSPMISVHPEIRAYTEISFTPGRPLAEALLEFATRIHDDFEYKSGATQIETTLEEFWEMRKGVCQDFSHLAVAGLRNVGLIAAYVSGYVMTYPPEGEEKRLGADASHAWVAVFVTGYGWVHVDPTNKIWVENDHVIVAMGRDYSDVPPLKGVCYGAAQQQPEVAVTMQRINPEETSYGH